VTVRWGREEQLSLVYFFDTIDRVTGGFPAAVQRRLPHGELEIDAQVTIDPERGSWARKAAEMTVTLRKQPGQREPLAFTTTMVTPASDCEAASLALVDLFPSVTADDLDIS
jgi:hypothetical protein